MKSLTTLALILAFSPFSRGQIFRQTFISSEIGNFRAGYEKIISTKATTLQYRYLKDLYLE